MPQAGGSSHGDGVHVHMSLGKKNTIDRLIDLSPFQKSSFLVDLKLAKTSGLEEVYDTSGFKPPYIVHLGISKLLNNNKFRILASNIVMKKRGVVVERRQQLRRMRVYILRDVDALLAAIGCDASVHGPQVIFSARIVPCILMVFP